jgi:ElaB/YqjD/DUF883 family membrane-anchored ribosome-binding protein
MTQRKKQPGETSKPSDTEVAERQAEIDRTRTEISDDLRTLGEKLSPDRLKSDAKEVMQEAKQVATETLHEAKDVATNTFREVKDSAMETVHEKVDDLRSSVRDVERQTRDFLSENALPLALMGIGAAWFFSKRRQHSSSRYDAGYDRQRSYTGPRFSDRGRWSSDSGPGVADRARQLRDQVGDRARDMAEGAGQKFDEVKGRARDFAEREADQVRRFAQDAEQRVSEGAEQAREFVSRELRDARDFSRRVSNENPLGVGLAAVAAGIGVGLLLPQTRPERELLGSTRDELVGEARQALSDLTQTAKETARDVKGSLSSSLSGSSAEHH